MSNKLFTVASRWIDTCLDVQTSLVEASYVRDKRGLRMSASRELVRARVGSVDPHAIDVEHFEMLRTFCLALSRRAGSFVYADDESDRHHPFRR